MRWLWIVDSGCSRRTGEPWNRFGFVKKGSDEGRYRIATDSVMRTAGSTCRTTGLSDGYNRLSFVSSPLCLFLRLGMAVY